MEDRRPGSGRYARLEREQRWVLDAVPTEARPRAEIVDRYLLGTRLRLRRMTSSDGLVLKLGQKVRVEATDPERVMVTSIYLSPEEFDVLATLPAAEIAKSRFVLPWGTGALAVDRFHGRLRGLVLAEIEHGPDDELLDPPPFARADVTHDDRYSGGELASATASEIAALLQRWI